MLLLSLVWVMAPVNADQVRLRSDTKQLVETVKNFRLEAVLRPVEALKKNSSADGLVDLMRVETAFFRETPRPVGWSVFFSSSVYTAAPLNDQSYIVVFYHPWSDTALVTVWGPKDRRFLMIQANLILGDCLRQFGKPPFEAQPAWEREAELLTPLLALPLATGETLQAFERIYPLSGVLISDSPFVAQRKNFEDSIQNGDVMNAVQSAANTRFGRSVTALLRYEKDTAFRIYKQAVDTILGNIRNGDISDIKVTMPMTNPETYNLIRDNAVVIGSQFKVVSVARTQKDCFIFLIHVADPNNVLALWLQTDKNKYGLRQATFMSHVFSASYLDQIQQKVQLIREPKWKLRETIL